MKIEINGDEIVFRLPINKPLKPSGTGKSLMVCTTNGIIATETLVDGRPMSVGINAFVSNPEYVKQPKGK